MLLFFFWKHMNWKFRNRIINKQDTSANQDVSQYSFVF